MTNERVTGPRGVRHHEEMRKALTALLCAAVLAWPACNKTSSQSSSGVRADCRQGQASNAAERNAENTMAGLKDPGGPSATPQANC